MVAMLEELEELEGRQRAGGRGWVLDTTKPSVSPASLRSARVLGLVELADRVERAELSALEGRPVRWAVRLTWRGRDVLTYARQCPSPSLHEPGAGHQRVELLPSQMTAVRTFVGLADELENMPAPGLAERVREAKQDHGAGRWLLYLTREQMESVAYGLWLHGMAGSSAEANRFGREYGIVHVPVDSRRVHEDPDTQRLA